MLQLAACQVLCTLAEILARTATTLHVSVYVFGGHSLFGGREQVCENISFMETHLLLSIDPGSEVSNGVNSSHIMSCKLIKLQKQSTILMT